MDGQSCVMIMNEWDIVAARQLGRHAAKELGFGAVDQARITTAISELARNIYHYANGGKIYIDKIEEKEKKELKLLPLIMGREFLIFARQWRMDLRRQEDLGLDCPVLSD